MKKKTTHVVPNEDGWGIRNGRDPKISKVFKRKNDAVKEARVISRHRKSELYIHNQDGKIASKDSHGGDPYPLKG